MELVTVRLPGFGSGAFCAAAGRAATIAMAAAASGRHTYFENKGFETIDPPIWNGRVSACGVALQSSPGRARWTPVTFDQRRWMRRCFVKEIARMALGAPPDLNKNVPSHENDNNDVAMRAQDARDASPAARRSTRGEHNRRPMRRSSHKCRAANFDL